MLFQAKYQIINDLNQLEKKQQEFKARLQNAIKDKANYPVRQSRYDYETDEDFEYNKYQKQLITDTIIRYKKQIKRYENRFLALYLNNKENIEFLYNELFNANEITSYKIVKFAEDLTPYLEEYIPVPENTQVPSNQSQQNSNRQKALIPIPQETIQQPLTHIDIFKPTKKNTFYDNPPN